MRNVRLRPRSEADIDAQFDFLANSSLEVAMRFVAAVQETTTFLAEMSDPGVLWDSDDLRLAEIRFWKVKGFPRHLVFFRASDDLIDVVRVLHAARDLEHVLTD